MADQTIPDVVSDALLHGQIKCDSLLSLAKVASEQRISLNRDITGISVVVLGAIITLFNLDPRQHFVRTTWLLYVAGGLLIVNIIIGFLARSILLQYLQDMVGVVEGAFIRTGEAVKTLRLISVETGVDATRSDRNAVAINKLIESEMPSNLPVLDRVGLYSHKWITVTLISALLCIVVSLIVRITF
jgi:hypothetical protein